MGKTNAVRDCFLVFAFLFLIPGTGYAKFDFNANCLKAYQYIFELKLGNARQLIGQEKRANPDNAIIPLLENYVDFFHLITTDNLEDYKRLKELKSSRIDKISDGDKSSPYYLYSQAEINLQWALMKSRYGEYLNAAMDIRKANGQLNENEKKFPGFHLNQKGVGLINAVLGNLPDGIMKSTLSTFGLKGDLNKGLAQMERLIINLPKSSYEPFYEETVFYYSFVLTDIARSPSAYTKTFKYTSRISDNSLLKTYLKAYVCMRSNRSEEAIQIISSRPTGAGYQSFPYLEYLMGIAKSNKLDYDATTHFKRFLTINEGVNYIKDTYLYLGWLAFLKGDSGGYKSYINKVKISGYTYNERDKQALKEAAAVPERELLKARLLFDGGYFTKSLALLTALNPQSLSSNKSRAEYFYRLGKNNYELGRLDLALAEFAKAQEYGKGLTAYYAANSALQMGKIYERKGDTTKARQQYNLAISMKNHDYESSIEQQAKSALRAL